MINILDYKRVVIVGLGGTGSILSLPLARFLFSIQSQHPFDIFYVDGDKYAPNNIERQNCSIGHMNRNKAECQAELVKTNVPNMTDTLTAIPKFLGAANINDIVVEGTIVINCSDNKAARKFVEDRALALNDCIHICCGNEKIRGQVQVAIRHKGEQVTPSIYERFPELNSSDGNRARMSCEELSRLPGGGQIICANMMAASLALNAFYALFQMNLLEEYPNECMMFNCLLNNVATHKAPVHA